MMQTRITKLFNIPYPIVQAGMIWTSGWKLAAAAAKAGALGLIGAGSMHPDNLRHHIRSAKQALAGTKGVFGVNVPLLYPQISEIMGIIIDEGVEVVFTSAGNPAAWTKSLQAAGCKVVHVTASTKFACKARDAGCDAVVAEGFEAGGHNGREETTTLVLIPLVVEAVGEDIPVIAAGGIGMGSQMAAALALGAEAVQVGSRFAATQEASCHPAFKTRIVAAKEGDTVLALKKTVPVRLLRNEFQQAVLAAEARGANTDELSALLGKGRAKRGMFEGDMVEGELEIGQVAASIHDIPTADEVVQRLMTDCQAILRRLGNGMG
ncbi:MAG: nitronate monooxygenase [Bacteroidetes Order II. Incertae sedis bacterium]|nr:nitronate monooxygenase [Bacteroidetes Order II. bacterium]